MKQTIDIKGIIARVQGLLEGITITRLSEIQATVQTYLVDTAGRLQVIVSGLADGSIPESDLPIYLQAEEANLMTILDVIKEQGLILAEEVINGVQDLAGNIFTSIEIQPVG